MALYSAYLLRDCQLPSYQIEVFDSMENGFNIGKYFFCTSMLFVLLVAHGQHEEKTSESEIEKMLSMIDESVDSTFIYKYVNSRFVPPEGKTLLVMGQTEERISEYMIRFPNRPLPGGWSAYWAITEFTGVKKSHKNSTGTSQNHQLLIDRFPNTAMHSAMWMVGKWDVAKNVFEGVYDSVAKQYANWAKSINRPIYLRIGYEFDGPHNQLEPDDYVKAYKYLVDFFRSEGVDNIAYVWHSYASKPYKNYPLSSWYPGDDYVDWVGISMFYQPYHGTDLDKETNDVLEFARDHQKPVMAAEVNPVLGVKKRGNKEWNTWFANFFSITYKKNIKAICFINENWQETIINGIEKWKDGRFYNNKKLSEAWFAETSKSRYLKQSPNLFNQLNYFK